MDAGSRKEDFLLLEDEKFDFDLSLSSSSTNEDDEVFFGPVGHKERCTAASLDLNRQVPKQPFALGSGSPCSWSPLTGEKFVEVYREAHLLALQIESHSRKEVAQAAKPRNPVNQGKETFVQDSQLKINLFEKEQKRDKSPTSLKRETFCLLSLTAQPLLGEPQLLASPGLLSSSVPAGPVQTQNNQSLPCSSQPLPRESGTSQPPSQAGPQRRITSKLQPPRALPVRGRNLHLAIDKLKKEVPASLQRTKLLNEKGPQSDVLLDKPSTAPDAAVGEVRPVKRSLPIPGKLGLKKTLLKPPGYTGNLTRKSSTSGSASSLASGVCGSSVAGKAKSSERSGIPAGSSRHRSSTSKLGRTGPATSHQALPAAPARAFCRQAKGADAAKTVAEQPKVPTPSPLTQQPQTPEQRGPSLDPDTETSLLNKTVSIKRRDSYLSCKTEAVSTTTNPFKVPQFSVGESPDGVTPKFSRTHRLQSWTPASRVVSSTPVRRPSGPTPQGLPSSMKTPLSARRMSVLPTPAGRRLSGLPLMAPQSMPRALVSPLCVPARRLSSEPRRSTVRVELTQKSSSGSGEQARGLSSNESSSPPSSVPQALNFSPEKSDFPPSQGSSTGAAQGEAEPREDAQPSEVHGGGCSYPPSEGILLDIKLDQLTISPEAGGRDLTDCPLIDFSNTPESNMALGPSSWPLIDLIMNTPDMGRNDAGKPLKAEIGQLIDLGSPLIQLNPEADKENVDSPLLKF